MLRAIRNHYRQTKVCAEFPDGAANLGWAYGDLNIGLEELKNKQKPKV